MDIKLEKKPWYVRHRYRIAAGAVLVAGLVYVAALASGPQKLRIDAESVQIAEVKNDDFMEYVDVEGVVHPILTLMVNVREDADPEAAGFGGGIRVEQNPQEFRAGRGRV